MSLYAGLDISVKTTAICVLDGDGRVLLETMVDSSPDAIAERLHGFEQPLERIGLEAGPLSQWIYGGLVDVGLAAICVETRHMHAALSARINKTDRNDARGIAQMMRVGLFKAVHVKTPASQHRRLLLTSRKLLQRKIYDIENDLRGSLRNFGLKVGVVGAAKYDDRIRELVADHPLVAAIVPRMQSPFAIIWNEQQRSAGCVGTSGVVLSETFDHCNAPSKPSDSTRCRGTDAEITRSRALPQIVRTEILALSFSSQPYTRTYRTAY